MSAKQIAIAVACLGLLAGCGSDPASNAASKDQSFEAALGMDKASLQAREATVQEAVRTCMKEQGFDYIPTDASQSNFKVAFGPETEDLTAAQRRTKGYGITTDELRPGRLQRDASDDPNQAIRKALSDADRKAYDTALMGAEAANAMEAAKDGAGGGGVRVQRKAGDTSEAAGAEDNGCMGKAQSETPGGPKEVGSDLQEMQQRIDADSRLIAAERDWSECMAKAGYTGLEQPDDARGQIRDEMDALMGADSDGEGTTRFAIGPDDIDPGKLEDLKQEEIALAVQDGKCQDETDLAKIAKTVTDENQQRFLDEHPDLTSGS
jgi:hypothetical protein